MGITLSKFIATKLFRYVHNYCKSNIEPKLPKEDNKLYQKLREKINSVGPITVADYMKDCLFDPEDGYYMRNEVIGATGDYTTSSEISQIFGEMIAIWFLYEWSKCGYPRPFQIVELGPGKGTLCHDMIGVIEQFIELSDVAVNFVEVSLKLSGQQAKKLCNKSIYTTKDVEYRRGIGAHGNLFRWYKDLNDVPKGVYTLFIGNEFLDTLPIRKYQKTDNGYKELLVDIDPENEKKFRLVLSTQETPMQQISSYVKDLRNHHIEYSAERILTIQNIAKRVETDGGIALLADYGHMGDKGDTFRAFRNHHIHDPFLEPGTADLTADVNFIEIKNAAVDGQSVLVFGPVSQRQFLHSLEGEERYKQLVKHSETLLNRNDWKERLEDGFKMLTDDDKMGERFQFLAIVPKNIEALLRKYPLCGFDGYVSGGK